MTVPTALSDRYAIERELGRGGMGAVYLARDLKLDRLVALKVLPAEFASDAGLRERFLRETRTAASFSHPNIVPVHAVEERDGVVAFAMGYVEGESLAERVRRMGPMDVRSIVRLLQDIGYALAYAHGRGVVHRDIKPDNIMLERSTGRALLMDFGISRSIATPVESKGLTRVGEVVGTPEYMSPEQASGDSVDGRSDLYSLGLVALFALTGAPVITGDSTQKILVKQLTERPPSAATFRNDLPPALSEAIDRCVAKQPEERFASAEALVEAIDAAQLSAPEIPVPVRLFAQEAGTLGLIMMFILVLSPYVINAMSTGNDADAIIPLILLFTIVMTRTLQTSAAARRLVNAGFPLEEIMSSMHGIIDEREAMRAYLRTDTDTLARRRRTVRMARLMVPMGIALVVLTVMRRVKTGPRQYTVGTSGMIMAISGIILVGVGMVLLLRSPLRPPIGEKFFKMVWLGPIGRAFLRFSARGAVQNRAVARPVISAAHTKAARTSTSPRQPGTPPPPAVFTAPAAEAIPNSIATSLRELAERVAELESAVNRKR